MKTFKKTKILPLSRLNAASDNLPIRYEVFIMNFDKFV